MIETIRSRNVRHGIGLMSGTSTDGIDAALVRIEGSGRTLKAELLAFRYVPYEAAFAARLLAADLGPVSLCELNAALGSRLAGVAADLCAYAAGMGVEVDFIGSHGHTMAHCPGSDPPGTLQIGEPAIIAERTGVTVVSNFRSRDMAAGGQGAPLVPYVDGLLFRDPEHPVACLNIGGIANVSWVPPHNDSVFAYDTGPGNMPINDAVHHLSDGRETYDADGARAARGGVHEAIYAALLNHPYFDAPPPKSTGREMFGWEHYLAPILQRFPSAGPDDVVASVTLAVAHGIAASIERYVFPMGKPARLIVSGGGVYNPVLMRELGKRLAGIEVTTTDRYGWPADAKEAVAVAILANETLCGVPANALKATGADRAVLLGNITPV